MKGEITLKVLEHISDAIVDFADLTAVLLDAGYGVSASKIRYEFVMRQNRRIKEQNEQLEKKRQRQRFYSMLYKLKKDGLIKESAKNKKSFFQITFKGKQRIEKLKKRQIDALPDNTYKECDLKSSKFTIVVFDIPERDRRKRAWLRSALKNFGFKMIQQSVLAGKVKMPEEFLNDLKGLHLIEYVEIFEINKSGSLQQLK